MLQNSAKFSFADLFSLFGEKSLLNIESNFYSAGVSTDTRTIEHGNIFAALKGEFSDGHQRIEEAFARGASAAIVSHDWYKNQEGIIREKPFITVRNTLAALGKLATFHRRRFGLPVVAIAGSNGKTTTKELTAHLLSQKFNVLKTQENFNNQLGVPLMLLMLDQSHEIAVIEIGTNEPGEIAILSSILEPTHGLITNIGNEHLEKLLDLDGVEMEETFLFGYLLKKEGFAFINHDDERLRKYKTQLENYSTFGLDDSADFSAKIETGREIHPILIFSVEGKGYDVKMQSSGYTTGLNALAASAVAVHFGLTGDEIKSGLESFQPVVSHGYGRMVLMKSGDLTIINDCYNANPDSMKAALSTLAEIPTDSPKYAVLGDMRELGDSSHCEHIKILEIAIGIADKIFLFGPEMEKGLGSIHNKGNIFHFDTKDELILTLNNSLKGNEIVLVKGSRGMKMEEVIEKIALG